MAFIGSIKVLAVVIRQIKTWYPCFLSKKKKKVMDGITGDWKWTSGFTCNSWVAVGNCSFNGLISTSCWICIKLLPPPLLTLKQDGFRRSVTPARITPVTFLGCRSPLSEPGPNDLTALKSTRLITSHTSHWNDQLGVTFLRRVCCQATLSLL